MKNVFYNYFKFFFFFYDRTVMTLVLMNAESWAKVWSEFVDSWVFGLGLQTHESEGLENLVPSLKIRKSKKLLIQKNFFLLGFWFQVLTTSSHSPNPK